jgi:hypothetical protein
MSTSTTTAPLRSSFAQIATALAAESQSITSFELSDHKNRTMGLNNNNNEPNNSNNNNNNNKATASGGPNQQTTTPVESPRERRAVFLLRLAIITVLIVAGVLFSVKVYDYTSVRFTHPFLCENFCTVPIYLFLMAICFSPIGSIEKTRISKSR